MRRRGSITTFCAEREMSGGTFYSIRTRAAQVGPALKLRWGRPRSSPSQIDDEVVEREVGVRAALEVPDPDREPIMFRETCCGSDGSRPCDGPAFPITGAWNRS